MLIKLHLLTKVEQSESGRRLSFLANKPAPNRAAPDDFSEHLLIRGFDPYRGLLINYALLADWTDWRTCISKAGLLERIAASAFASSVGGVSGAGAGAWVITPLP